MADRQEAWRLPVTYGAVGGTQAVDLMTYPPKGYRPFERRARIGHGDARWEWARTELLSWGIKRRSGFEVERTDAPGDVSEIGYTGVGYDESGTPVQAASLVAGDEIEYAPDGTALVKPGDTAVLVAKVGPFRVHEPVRVVYRIDEPQRTGFAYGTLPGHPLSGEESFIIDRTEDGSVWLTIRSLSRPAGFGWKLLGPLLRVAHRRYLARYMLALAGPTE